MMCPLLFLLPLQRCCLGTRTRGFLRVVSALSALWCPHLSVWTRQRQLWGRRVGKGFWLERSLISAILELDLGTVIKRKEITFFCRPQSKHIAAWDSFTCLWTGPSAGLLLLEPSGEILRAKSFPNPPFECLCLTARSWDQHTATHSSWVKCTAKDALSKGLPYSDIPKR